MSSRPIHPVGNLPRKKPRASIGARGFLQCFTIKQAESPRLESWEQSPQAGSLMGPSRRRFLPDANRIACIAFSRSSARGARSPAACSHYQVFHLQQFLIIHIHMDRIGGSSGCSFEPEFLVEPHGFLF